MDVRLRIVALFLGKATRQNFHSQFSIPVTTQFISFPYLFICSNCGSVKLTRGLLLLQSSNKVGLTVHNQGLTADCELKKVKLKKS